MYVIINLINLQLRKLRNNVQKKRTNWATDPRKNGNKGPQNKQPSLVQDDNVCNNYVRSLDIPGSLSSSMERPRTTPRCASGDFANQMDRYKLFRVKDIVLWLADWAGRRPELNEDWTLNPVVSIWGGLFIIIAHTFIRGWWLLVSDREKFSLCQQHLQPLL